VIVHDLQTRERSFFICNEWLAIDKGDGSVERLLPVVGDAQKQDMMYLIQKQTKEKLADTHLWLSVFAKPTLSSFTRVDRLTCCFDFLYLTMLLNIMYYGQDKSATPLGFKLGPFSFSLAQVTIKIKFFKYFN
jgi:polycystin 1L2